MLEKLKAWIMRRFLRKCPYCGFGEIKAEDTYCRECGRHLKTGRRAAGK